MNDNKAIIKGSIMDVANGNTALALLDAKLLIICDRSGSMTGHDAMGGKARYEVEDEIVRDLQAKYPGQVVLEAFGDSAILCLNGELPYPNSGSTVYSYALKLAQSLVKTGMRAVLISDGEASDSWDEIRRAAEPLRGALDIVFVGPDITPGRNLLDKLSAYVSGTLDYNDLQNQQKLFETLERKLLGSGA